MGALAKFTPLRAPEFARLIAGDATISVIVCFPVPHAGGDCADDDLIGPAEPRPAVAGWQAQQGDIDSEMPTAGVTQTGGSAASGERVQIVDDADGPRGRLSPHRRRNRNVFRDPD